MTLHVHSNKQMTYRPGPIPKVLAVTGGKGGVGKTLVSINIAATLALSGQRVTLMDADMGLANIDVLLGIKSNKNLSHVLQDEIELEDIIVPGPCGMSIIPASQGVKKMANLSKAELSGLIQRFSVLAGKTDYLVIDTAAGISDMVVGLVGAAHEVLVVVCDDPASLADAYALMKVLNYTYGVQNFKIIVNMSKSLEESHEVFAKLTKVADRFLNVSLNWMGCIPYDSNVVKALRKQKPVVAQYPEAKIAEAFKKLVNRVMLFPKMSAFQGQQQFFSECLWEKLKLVQQ